MKRPSRVPRASPLREQLSDLCVVQSETLEIILASFLRLRSRRSQGQSPLAHALRVSRRVVAAGDAPKRTSRGQGSDENGTDGDEEDCQVARLGFPAGVDGLRARRLVVRVVRRSCLSVFLSLFLSFDRVRDTPMIHSERSTASRAARTTVRSPGWCRKRRARPGWSRSSDGSANK